MPKKNFFNQMKQMFDARPMVAVAKDAAVNIKKELRVPGVVLEKLAQEIAKSGSTFTVTIPLNESKNRPS